MKFKTLPKRRVFCAALFVLLLTMVGQMELSAQNQGGINGVFSVSANTQVVFSQGNLQYQASTNTWRFAEHQYDYVGADNSNISQTNTGWIDLFGWGTSGYNHGAVCYQPWSRSQKSSDYYAYGQDTYNLYDQTGQADWGYNAISNGGNQTGKWRTLTQPEWNYLFNTRTTNSGIRYAKAIVAGVNGVILFPDNWDISFYAPDNANQGDKSFNNNTINSAIWSALEDMGCVFLPAAGYRGGTSVSTVGSRGYYWSASYYNSYVAWYVAFYSSDLYMGSNLDRYYGLSVRLVCPAENYSLAIPVQGVPNPAGGGAVSGGGAYQQGAACTLTATPAEGFTFVNWTENGQVVSTNAQFSLTVNSQRLLVANFTKPGNITFADANVKSVCVANWDTNGDGELSYNEAAAVTYLGTVFQNNTNITSFAELPYFIGLTEITSSAFSGCTSLTSIGLPSTLTGIGSNAFNNCTALTSVYYMGTIAQWCGIQFGNGTANPLNYASLFYINNVLTRNVVIPNTVTSIGDYAFYNYRSLLSLSLPEGLTSIGDGAFYNCSGITGALSLPSSVTNIGDYAFYTCTGLTGELVLPNSLENLGNYAFYGCTGLSGNLILPNALTSIGNDAFYGCTGFNGELTLPNALVSIGEKAFYGCTGFTGSLTIPNTVTNIGGLAFYDCHSFTGSLILSESLQSIQSRTFANCYGFTGELIIPNSVTTLPSIETQGAFYNCDGITRVVISNSVTNIGSGSFADCDGLTSVTIGTGVTQIRGSAFYYCDNLSEVNYNATSCGSGYLFEGCNNLRTLSIGENVLSLPAYAFTNNSNLERINSGATTPPIITSNVFNSNILGSVAVYVPCEAKADYQADPIWGNFTNYQSSAFLLTVEAEDPTQGYVSIEQYGDCDNPLSVVKADPMLHYGFVGWLKDGVQVSTDRIYSFDLTENTHLVARFENNENITLHWVPNSASYEDYMSLIAVVNIDGTEQAVTTLELGAFCGTECRGSVLASYFPPTDRYLYQLPVYGNNGDAISFRLFDHNTQQELALVCETDLTYTHNGCGSLGNPYAIDFLSSVAITVAVNPSNAGMVAGSGNYYPGETATLVATANDGFVFNSFKENGTVVSTDATYSFTVTEARNLTAYFHRQQTTALANGWNWYSTYIEQSGIEGLTMLEESLGANGMLIKSRSGLMVENYEGSYWWGGLNAIDNEQMYEVRTNQACEAILQGDVANPYSHPITINPGWNWIGFVSPSEMALGTALGTLTPVENDAVKSRSTFSTYFPNYGWYGSLETLVPGQGYKYQSLGTSTQTLRYPNSSKGRATVNATAAPTHFQVRADNQRYNMTVMASVELDGMELSGETYELAAFAGDVCRGSVKLQYVEPLNRTVAFLAVLGEGEETLTFRLYDEATGLTYEAEEPLAFEADVMVGRSNALHPVRFNSQAVVESSIMLFPNPVGSGEEFYVETGYDNPTMMEIVNMLGETVKRIQVTQGQRLVCDLAPGIYTVCLVKGRETLCVQKLVVK